MMKEVINLNIFKPAMMLEQAKIILNSVCSLVSLDLPLEEKNLTTVLELLSMFESDDKCMCDYDYYLNNLEKEHPLGTDHPAIYWRDMCSATGKDLTFIASLAQDIVSKVSTHDCFVMTEVTNEKTHLIPCRVISLPDELYRRN